MQDVIYGTISGEEHARLDKLDAERRAHMERLTQDADARRAIHAALYDVTALPADQVSNPDRSSAAEIKPRLECHLARPWRPEQHAADTVLSHFDTSGKAVTHE